MTTDPVILTIVALVAVYLVGFVLAARYIPTRCDEPGHEHSYSAHTGCDPETEAMCNGVFWPFLLGFGLLFALFGKLHKGAT